MNEKNVIDVELYHYCLFLTRHYKDELYTYPNYKLLLKLRVIVFFSDV